MTEIYLAKQGKALIPANDSDADAVAKLKNGQVYKADVVAPRNLKFHRKNFALLNLAFQYWQPESMVAEVEKNTVYHFGNYLTKNGVSTDAVQALQSAFLQQLEFNRNQVETEKDFESFRAWITVESGFYTLVNSPAGPRKVPKSISFASMDDIDFGNYYKQVLNTCWKLCLHRIFSNQDQLAEKLLSFE
jgi:hypothetical protein